MVYAEKRAHETSPNFIQSSCDCHSGRGPRDRSALMRSVASRPPFLAKVTAGLQFPSLVVLAWSEDSHVPWPVAFPVAMVPLPFTASGLSGSFGSGVCRVQSQSRPASSQALAASTFCRLQGAALCAGFEMSRTSRMLERPSSMTFSTATWKPASLAAVAKEALADDFSRSAHAKS